MNCIVNNNCKYDVIYFWIRSIGYAVTDSEMVLRINGHGSGFVLGNVSLCE